MLMHNATQIAGNLVAAPAVNGKTVTCTVAVNSSYRDKEGNLVEEVDYIDCVAFGRTGEVLAQHATKGSPLFIEGRLKQNRWETSEGDKRSKLEVRITSWKFSAPKRSGGRAGGDEADVEAQAAVAAAMAEEG